MQTLTRRAAKAAIAAAVSLPLVVGAATPADASSKWQYRSSGSSVAISWMEMGEIPGVGGNVHVGYLDASSDGWAWGEVVDWTCPEGELPPDHGGHGPHGEAVFFEDDWDDDWDDDDWKETNCVVESFRWIEGEGLEVKLDKKLTTARITGTVSVADHDGAGGNPPVDITVTGIGETATTSYQETHREGKDRYVSKYDSTSRVGTVDGFIGAMGFADDEDDQSKAWMSHWKVSERGMSR